MKKSISLAATLALSSMLASPVAISADEGAPSSGVAATGQVTPGFYWCKGQQTYRVIGDNKTWLYLESCLSAGLAPIWVWCDDNECEKTFIAAAASTHYIGLNFNTATTFNIVRLFKF